MAQLTCLTLWGGGQGHLIISDVKKEKYLDEAQLKNNKIKKREHKNGPHLNAIKDFTANSTRNGLNSFKPNVNPNYFLVKWLHIHFALMNIKVVKVQTQTVKCLISWYF